MTSRIGIVGATGYTGQELARLLRTHPGLELTASFSTRAGQASVQGEVAARRAGVEALDVERFDELDGLFLCTPHKASAELAREALGRGVKVVDLSADFRLRDADLYEEVYGIPHAAPELLDEAVYGLTERARVRVVEARLVANPGCYPTSILLPLLPLLDAGCVDTSTTIVASSASGASGAGARAQERTHFGSVHENFLAYGIGTHRHAPEIWQELGTERLAFVPHLLPNFRGILSTLYLDPAAGVTPLAARIALQEAYGREPFVEVLEGDLPELRDVNGTNMCVMAVREAAGKLVVVSALDNLLKGAAGQALQNMNLMLGHEETLGLEAGLFHEVTS